MRKKGEYLVNPKMRYEWGVGIVTEDQRDDTVKVFFENTSSVKVVKESFLEPISDPGESTLYLQNALVDEGAAAKYDRLPFPFVLKRFLELFPGGFKGERYISEEREYKMAGIEWANLHLSREIWKGYLDSSDYESLSAELRRFYSKINLLASYEVIKLNDVLKDSDTQKPLCDALYNLLYGEAPLSERFEATKSVLERYGIAKWPIITYPLFVLFPETQMFIKPEMTQAAAATRGFDIQYDSQLNWNTYSRVVSLSLDLKERLIASGNEALQPADMVDIQGFMWCTFSKLGGDGSYTKN